MRRAWSPAEEARLRRLAPRKTAQEIARLLNRTEKSVVARARSLGIVRQKYGEAHASCRYGDATVLEMLRRYFHDGQTIRQIAAEMDVPRATVVGFTTGQRRGHLRREFLK